MTRRLEVVGILVGGALLGVLVYPIGVRVLVLLDYLLRDASGAVITACLVGFAAPILATLLFLRVRRAFRLWMYGDGPGFPFNHRRSR